MSKKGINFNLGFQPPVTLQVTPQHSHHPPHHHHHHHHHPTAPPPPVIQICPPHPGPTYPTNPGPTYPTNPGVGAADGYSWVSTTIQMCYTLEHKAVVAGFDYDRSPIYVGRTYHNGELIPCKVVPKHRIASFAYDSRENSTSNFEMYCRNTPRVEWMPSNNGQVPPGAVQVGHTSSGEPLYAGRAHHNGTLTVGKVHPSHGSCYISHSGQEIAYKVYEVMVHVY